MRCLINRRIHCHSHSSRCELIGESMFWGNHLLKGSHTSAAEFIRGAARLQRQVSLVDIVHSTPGDAHRAFGELLAPPWTTPYGIHSGESHGLKGQVGAHFVEHRLRSSALLGARRGGGANPTMSVSPNKTVFRALPAAPLRPPATPRGWNGGAERGAAPNHKSSAPLAFSQLQKPRGPPAAPPPAAPPPADSPPSSYLAASSYLATPASCLASSLQLRRFLGLRSLASRFEVYFGGDENSPGNRGGRYRYSADVACLPRRGFENRSRMHVLRGVAPVRHRNRACPGAQPRGGRVAGLADLWSSGLRTPTRTSRWTSKLVVLARAGAWRQIANGHQRAIDPRYLPKAKFSCPISWDPEISSPVALATPSYPISFRLAGGLPGRDQ
jgi:hypothetical protein